MINFHLIPCKCFDFDLEHVFEVIKCVVTKFKMAAADMNCENTTHFLVRLHYGTRRFLLRLFRYYARWRLLHQLEFFLDKLRHFSTIQPGLAKLARPSGNIAIPIKNTTAIWENSKWKIWWLPLSYRFEFLEPLTNLHQNQWKYFDFYAGHLYSTTKTANNKISNSSE